MQGRVAKHLKIKNTSYGGSVKVGEANFTASVVLILIPEWRFTCKYANISPAAAAALF